MDINVQELKEKLERGDDFILIDVREPHEHEEFNVGGSLCPLGNIMNTISEFEEHKNKEVVVYCRSGRRSATAQAFMQQAGYANVRNLEGGMLEWMNSFGMTKP